MFIHVEACVVHVCEVSDEQRDCGRHQKCGVCGEVKCITFYLVKYVWLCIHVCSL